MKNNTSTCTMTSANAFNPFYRCAQFILIIDLLGLYPFFFSKSIPLDAVFFFFFFYALHCCVRLCCKMKYVSCMYT